MLFTNFILQYIGWIGTYKNGLNLSITILGGNVITRGRVMFNLKFWLILVSIFWLFFCITCSLFHIPLTSYPCREILIRFGPLIIITIICPENVSVLIRLIRVPSSLSHKGQQSKFESWLSLEFSLFLWERAISLTLVFGGPRALWPCFVWVGHQNF